MSLPQRHKSRQSRASLLISIVFHVVVVGLVAYLAARQGMLGKVAKDMVAVQVEEKKPTPQKPKDEPKPLPEKVNPDQKPNPVVQTPVPITTPAPAPQPGDAPPPVDAPAAADAPEMYIPNANAGGGGEVLTPEESYRRTIQSVFLSVWDKPVGIDDSSFSADVEMTLDRRGRIEAARFVRGSGDSKWDDSVRAALNKIKDIGAPPPDKFPPSFSVRFDAVAESVPVQ